MRRTRLCYERRWSGVQVAHRKTQGDERFSGAIGGKRLAVSFSRRSPERTRASNALWGTGIMQLYELYPIYEIY